MHTSGKNGASGCPASVLELVARFDLHSETYKQQTYNETQVRREFIDRVAYVDKEFGEGPQFPGWATGRGRIYLVLGRPKAVLRTERRFFVDGALRSLTLWQ
ncbi:MAG: GWxTD domain-containing protein [Planctomycetes bacterium]|nr:GWxTD domain-containing protein [Planctomycetota bacterium]